MSTHSVYQYTSSGRLSTTLFRASRSTPHAARDQCLIKVKAAALNPVDGQLAQSSPRLLKFMGGAMPPPSEQNPWIPGCDFAGVVVQTGPDSAWKIGDEVYGMRPFGTTQGDGTLQEYLLGDSSWPISRKPPSISFTEAAALPLVYGTVHDVLVKHGRLPFEPAPEEVGKRTVLILGGSSGTGSVAVQLAKKMGLKVVATCSTQKVDLVKSLGADEVIDYTKGNVPDAAKRSPYAPFAVILDCVGGREAVDQMDSLVLHDPEQPELGIYVTIVGDKTGRDQMGGALTNYYYPAQAFRTLRGSLQDYLPRWTPYKSYIAGTRYRCISLEASKEVLDTIPAFLESARKVIIDSTWEFSDVRKAFERLESGRAVGKVVVTVDSILSIQTAEISCPRSATRSGK